MDIKHFPKGYHPSSSQQYAIPNIVDSLSKYKFIIVQGPTGCGKSFIAKTIANGLNKPPPRLTKLVKNYTAFDTRWENGKLVLHFDKKINVRN